MATSAGIVWLVCAPHLCAQEVDETKALQVKAAYLYNFAKFVQWPDEAFENEESPITIGVIGVDPFGAILDATVKDKTVGKRTFVIRRFAYLEEDNIEALRKCHVLYVSESERRRLKEILRAVDDANVLVVGEGEAFALAGGMIGLVLEEGTIAFHVNLTAVKRTELRISANLLDLAKIIETGASLMEMRPFPGGRARYGCGTVCSRAQVTGRPVESTVGVT